jgi:hypothetical protein
MIDGNEKLHPSIRPRATARADSAQNSVSWASRDIDIEGIRRWFIGRIALEAVEQLKRDEQNEPR